MTSAHQQALARGRIELLFAEAAKLFPTHPERADRYVALARRLGMRYTVRVPKTYRLNYCRQCNSFLKVGVNARIRTRSDTKAVVFTCMKCGWIRRFPYAKGSAQKTGSSSADSP